MVCLCCVFQFSYGQGDKQSNPIALNVGDVFPYRVLERVVNYSDSTLDVADFEGKALLLDFWATWCKPCVAAFPKLEAMQRKFADELQIILLSNDDPRRIDDFYASNSNLVLPTVLFDSADDFRALFPHREIPHYVWIGKDRTILAITDGTQLSEESIARFLRSDVAGVTMKDDFSTGGFDSLGNVVDSIVVIHGVAKSVSLSPNVVFESKITKFDPRLTHSMSMGRGKDYGHRFLEMQNVSVVHMMQWGLGYTSSKDMWRFFLDLNDSTLTYPTGNYKEWERKHSYTYRLVLNEPDSARRFAIMRRDVEAVFGLTANEKRLKVPTLVLRRIKGSKVPLAASSDSTYASGTIYGITLVNQPIDMLLKVFNHYKVGKEYRLSQQIMLPVLDKTGITGSIDLKIQDCPIQDMEALNKSLKEFGLEVNVEERKMKMIVITDKNPSL